jgi:GT2 family glycosyltransferase
MMIPYDPGKNLGRAYNEAMIMVPDHDWACLMDYDVMLLTPDAGKILQEYASRADNNTLLTCYTNRVSRLSTMQLLTGTISEEADIREHIKLAEKQKHLLYQATEIRRDISGMLMLLSKNLWLRYNFPDNGGCLGVDTLYNRMLRGAGKKIMRMDGLYVFHAYRLTTGINNKTHLL